MKKSILLSISILMLSGSIYANDSVIADNSISNILKADKSTFYLGTGYGYFKQKASDISIDADSILLQAGYKYNKYLAVEGRYWYGVGGISQSGGNSGVNQAGDFSAWSFYLKPMYPVDSASFYILLGYAYSSISYDQGSNWDSDGFSWGVGGEYAFSENIALFADYVSMAAQDSVKVNSLDYPTSIDLYTVNVGVTYKF